MCLGFAALHSKGVRPEKTSQNETKSLWLGCQKATLVGCFCHLSWGRTTAKSKHWCLNTENNLIQFTLLFIFRKSEKQHSLNQGRVWIFSLCWIPEGRDAKPSWMWGNHQHELLRWGAHLNLLCWASEVTQAKQNGKQGRKAFCTKWNSSHE